jgi:2,4-dienoyl-CoA reductase-like NADH-dependent reductase (Old Yellow Enzyme family)
MGRLMMPEKQTLILAINATGTFAGIVGERPRTRCCLWKGGLKIGPPTTGNAVIAAGHADLVAFGVPFIANPDLVERLRRDAPLAKPDPATFYGSGPKDYTDYPSRADAV